MVLIHHPDARLLALMLQPLVFANTFNLNRPLAELPAEHSAEHSANAAAETFLIGSAGHD